MKNNEFVCQYGGRIETWASLYKEFNQAGNNAETAKVAEQMGDYYEGLGETSLATKSYKLAIERYKKAKWYDEARRLGRILNRSRLVMLGRKIGQRTFLATGLFWVDYIEAGLKTVRKRRLNMIFEGDNRTNVRIKVLHYLEDYVKANYGKEATIRQDKKRLLNINPYSPAEKKRKKIRSERVQERLF